MPEKKGRGRRGTSYVFFVVIVTLLFAFSPISKGLLHLVHGSFAPSPYSSLSLSTQTERNVGTLVGRRVAVSLTNDTGIIKRYHWTATQNGVLISQGEVTLGTGHADNILISSKGARVGRLRITLKGTDIFVTVTMLKSRS